MRTGNNYSGVRRLFSTTTTRAKLAAIREEGYPIGVVAPCWFHCPCGSKIPAHTGIDQPCACGKVYDSSGWVVR